MNSGKLLSIACLTLMLNASLTLAVFAEEPETVINETSCEEDCALTSDEAGDLDAVEENDLDDVKEVKLVNVDSGSLAEAEKSNSVDIEEKDVGELPDPLYYLNYAAFLFNDKLYYWVIKPTAKGYENVTPEIMRDGLRNFFRNLRSPVNVINNLLQFKPDRFGLELFRFVTNTVLGVGGFYDASSKLFGIDEQKAGLGQTLGYYGVGPGLYHVWPFLGPSSSRDTAGIAGDMMMSPPTYMGFFWCNVWQSGCALTTEKINIASFDRGEYDLSKAVDEYDALKNASTQYNAEMVRRAKNR